MMGQTLRAARRLVILVIGSTVVLLGIVMLVTPGPAFVLIPAGIAILATEFVWAQRLLRRVRKEVANAANRMSNGQSADDPSIPWHRRLMCRVARACHPGDHSNPGEHGSSEGGESRDGSSTEGCSAAVDGGDQAGSRSDEAQPAAHASSAGEHHRAENRTTL